MSYSTRTPYERNYYPGTKNAVTARTVRIGVAQSVSNINWRIGPPLPQRLITGKVLAPDGNPVFPTLSFMVEGHSGDNNADYAKNNKDGTFAFEGLKGVRYRVRVVGSRDGGEKWHSEPFPVPDTDAPLTIRLDRPGRDCETCRKWR